VEPGVGGQLQVAIGRGRVAPDERAHAVLGAGLRAHRRQRGHARAERLRRLRLGLSLGLRVGQDRRAGVDVLDLSVVRRKVGQGDGRVVALGERERVDVLGVQGARGHAERAEQEHSGKQGLGLAVHRASNDAWWNASNEQKGTAARVCSLACFPPQGYSARRS
jgi:hypothetical protein